MPSLPGPAVACLLRLCAQAGEPVQVPPLLHLCQRLQHQVSPPCLRLLACLTLMLSQLSAHLLCAGAALFRGFRNAGQRPAPQPRACSVCTHLMTCRGLSLTLCVCLVPARKGRERGRAFDQGGLRDPAQLALVVSPASLLWPWPCLFCCGLGLSFSVVFMVVTRGVVAGTTRSCF